MKRVLQFFSGLLTHSSVRGILTLLVFNAAVSLWNSGQRSNIGTAFSYSASIGVNILSALFLSETRSLFGLGRLRAKRVMHVMIGANVKLALSLLAVFIVPILITVYFYPGFTKDNKSYIFLYSVSLFGICWNSLGLALAIFLDDTAEISKRTFALARDHFKRLSPIFLFSTMTVLISFAFWLATGMQEQSSVLFSAPYGVIRGFILWVILPKLYLDACRELVPPQK